MQIKSWQIALVGSIPILGLFGLITLFLILVGYEKNIFNAIRLIIPFFAVVLIPVLLLKDRSEKVGLIGASISIIFGFLEFLYFIFGQGISSDLFLNDIFFFLAFISELSLIFAGIHYFWKKV